MASDKKSGESSNSSKSRAEILSEFQILRNERSTIDHKLSGMEMELCRHKIIIKRLKKVEPERKCYRMRGGVLCEQTAGDILPELETSREQLMKVMDALNEQLTKKGIEINEFMEKHNIRIRERIPVCTTTK